MIYLRKVRPSVSPVKKCTEYQEYFTGTTLFPAKNCKQSWTFRCLNYQVLSAQLAKMEALKEQFDELGVVPSEDVLAKCNLIFK